MDRFHRACAPSLALDIIELTNTVTHENLPLRLVRATSIFYLCGGGNYAQEAMTSVMIAAACSETDRSVKSVTKIELILRP